jgi:hypothetical protein
MKARSQSGLRSEIERSSHAAEIMSFCHPFNGSSVMLGGAACVVVSTIVPGLIGDEVRSGRGSITLTPSMAAWSQT